MRHSAPGGTRCYIIGQEAEGLAVGSRWRGRSVTSSVKSVGTEMKGTGERDPTLQMAQKQGEYSGKAESTSLLIL
jgi:hypothetical protein